MRKQAREHSMYTLEIATDSPARLRRVEVHLPPMAVWIFLVGHIIYRYCQSNQDGTGEPEVQKWIGGRDGGNQLWTRRDGFSLERWDFWKRRLEVISRLNEASEEARQHAFKAAAEMQKIESEEEH